VAILAPLKLPNGTPVTLNTWEETGLGMAALDTNDEGGKVVVLPHLGNPSTCRAEDGIASMAEDV
jgi:hypothetical protein